MGPEDVRIGSARLERATCCSTRSEQRPAGVRRDPLLKPAHFHRPTALAPCSGNVTRNRVPILRRTAMNFGDDGVERQALARSEAKRASPRLRPHDGLAGQRNSSSDQPQKRKRPDPHRSGIGPSSAPPRLRPKATRRSTRSLLIQSRYQPGSDTGATRETVYRHRCPLPCSEDAGFAQKLWRKRSQVFLDLWRRSTPRPLGRQVAGVSFGPWSTSLQSVAPVSTQDDRGGALRYFVYFSELSDLRHGPGGLAHGNCCCSYRSAPCPRGARD